MSANLVLRFFEFKIVLSEMFLSFSSIFSTNKTMSLSNLNFIIYRFIGNE